jgi:UAF complex subunit Rrn10
MAAQNQEEAWLPKDGVDPKPPQSKIKRVATVYDAVSGRVGLNGFLTQAQMLSTNINPLTPEEVLFRRVNAPLNIPQSYYSADSRLKQNQRLPDSDLVKAIHAYASDFYTAATHDKGKHDFKTLNDTALLAMGILLEEAANEVLGETGDMVLVEPEGLENRLPESRMVQHQVKGRVKPPSTPEYVSEESDEEQEEMRPRKRRRSRHGVAAEDGL